MKFSVLSNNLKPCPNFLFNKQKQAEIGEYNSFHVFREEKKGRTSVIVKSKYSITNRRFAEKEFASSGNKNTEN